MLHYLAVINLTDASGLFFSVCWHSIIFGFTFLLDGVELPDYFWGIPAEFCIFLFIGIIRELPEKESKCEIKVRIRKIKGIPGLLGYLHAYIVTRTIGFFPFYFGAGPTGSFPSWGKLKAKADFYDSDVGDDFTREVKAEATVEKSGACGSYNQTFTELTHRTNDANIDYEPKGNNSNRFVYTLLSRAGLVAEFEPKIRIQIGSFNDLPGWGKELPI